jgi:ATP-dependent exoDNAse (exonuclease V) alpha subunit
VAVSCLLQRATNASRVVVGQHVNLLYTGVTRGKRPVVLVGQKRAVAVAVKNVSGRRRWSKLE